MINRTPYDVVIIGGGIVGLATALALSKRGHTRLLVLEAEPRLAAHQTGHNSGVIHAGLYYKPGSAKARTCVTGRTALYRFCQQHDISHEQCGKLVVATQPHELPQLDKLAQRAEANGLHGVRRLRPAELREHEPHVVGIAGLLVPQTGIVDYTQVARAYARLVCQAGGTIQVGTRLLGCQPQTDGLLLQTTLGDIACRHLINCAGLQADRVARLCGVDPGLKIVPFRGEYYELRPEKQNLVNNLIYPVPDPRFPFLGVHFTRMIHGGVEAGPNAVLAFKREGYRRTSFSWRDSWETLSYPGFWRLAGKYWRMGLAEFYRSLSKKAFVQALQRLLPALTMADVQPAGAGVRAQALDSMGKLLDDFHIIERHRMTHVLNAPSPAATASLSIGQTVAVMVEEQIEPTRGKRVATT